MPLRRTDKSTKAQRAADGVARLLGAAFPALVVAAGVLALLDAACAAVGATYGVTGLMLGVVWPAAALVLVLAVPGGSRADDRLHVAGRRRDPQRLGGSDRQRRKRRLRETRDTGLGRGGRLRGLAATLLALLAVVALLGLALRGDFLAQLQPVAQSAAAGGVLWQAGLGGMRADLVIGGLGAALFCALYLLAFALPLGWLAGAGLVALLVFEAWAPLYPSLFQMGCVAFFVVGGSIVRQLGRVGTTVHTQRRVRAVARSLRGAAAAVPRGGAPTGAPIRIRPVETPLRRAGKAAVRPGSAPGSRQSTLLAPTLIGLAVALLAAFAVPVAYTVLRQTTALGQVTARASRLTTHLREAVGRPAQQQAPASATGAVSRGNNYATGASQFTVYTLAEPTETIYLKQFTGGAYVGDGWDADGDGLAAYMEQHPVRDPSGEAVSVAQVVSAQHDALVSAYMRGSAGGDAAGGPDVSTGYLADNTAYGEDGAALADNPSASADALGLGEMSPYDTPSLSQYQAHQIGVERVEGAADQPVPYYADNTAGESGYVTYQYFSPTEALEAPTLLTALQRAEFDARLSALAGYAREQYLDVPRDRLPQLTELAAQNPQDSGDALAAVEAARRLLADRAVYTRTPGEATGSGDIVEEFLFARHAGYCQQFASAATLLLRLWGVPARYACGYAAPARLFERAAVSERQMADGASFAYDFATGAAFRYEATLTGLQQHAWVEVFVDGAGWVPVEVTPPAPAAAPDNEPAASVADAEPLAATDAGQDRAAGSANADASDAADVSDEHNDAGLLGAAFAGVAEALAGLWAQGPVRAALVAAGALAVAAAGVLLRRALLHQWLARQAPDVLLAHAVRVLHRCGLARGFATGYEPGFAAALGNLRVPAQILVDAAARARYSAIGIDAAGRAEAVRAHAAIVRALLARARADRGRPRRIRLGRTLYLRFWA